VTKSKFYAHSSTGSKRAIFTFIATLTVCLLLLDNTAGLFTGAIYVFVGMFTASVAVAMPFYFYKKKHPKAYYLASMIELLVTIWLTVVIFSYFFTNPLDFTTTASPSDNDNLYIVWCDEPVPQFTLGMDVIPSKVQANAICSCIWKKLSALDKNLSASLARNEPHDASEAQLRLFMSRLGVATASCRTEGF
jgi:riboflavin transporter FmnP